MPGLPRPRRLPEMVAMVVIKNRRIRDLEDMVANLMHEKAILERKLEEARGGQQAEGTEGHASAGH